MSLRGRTDLTVTGTGNGETGKSLRPVTSSTAIAKPDGRAKTAIAQASALTGGKSGNVGFIVDATASRSGFWAESVGITQRMFSKVGSVGKMALRLVHYGGSVPPVDRGWVMTPDAIATQIGEVTPQGGATQILQSFGFYLADRPIEQARSIILVGDCYEEEGQHGHHSITPDDDVQLEAHFPQARAMAEQLKLKGIKVFACQEGLDPTARVVFKMLARVTGGKYFKLGDDMPLDEICENIALLAIGGEAAVKRLGRGRSASLLLTDGTGGGNNPGMP